MRARATNLIENLTQSHQILEAKLGTLIAHCDERVGSRQICPTRGQPQQLTVLVDYMKGVRTKTIPPINDLKGLAKQWAERVGDNTRTCMTRGAWCSWRAW